MSELDKILEIASENNNIFKTKMIVDAGIRKEKIKELLDEKRIKRIGPGYYALTDSFVDRYYELQQRCSRGIYSFGTAAYFWGLLDHIPEEIECTFPRGFNATRLNLRFETKFHFAPEQFYQIGVTEIQSPLGALVKVYDKEKVVCDFIKYKSRCDIRTWGTVLNNYFRRRDKDLKKLIKYAKIYGILDELEMYVELLQ